MMQNVVQYPPGMSITDIRTYLAAAGRSAKSDDELIRSHIVDASDGQFPQVIPVDVCWRIFLEHAAIVGDEMHNVVESRLKPGVTSLLISRMLLCDTLQDAIRAYSDASALLAGELEVTDRRRKDGVSLRWRFKRGTSDLHCIVLEATAVVYYAIFSWLIGETLPVLRVRAPARRQDSTSTLFNVLDAPVVRDGDAVELFFSEDVVQKRTEQRDIRNWYDGVYKILSAAVLRYCAPSARGAFTTKVRAALLQGYGQKQIADQWGMSTKTIARRLAQEGSSYRQLRDEIRMAKAISLLHADVSVEEIGYLVGYEDPRSFRRAFVRWFGANPSTYRRRHLGAS